MGKQWVPVSVTETSCFALAEAAVTQVVLPLRSVQICHSVWRVGVVSNVNLRPSSPSLRRMRRMLRRRRATGR